MGKTVIFNADDFGASPEINGGILDCHRDGVVTSASLMVTGAAAREAAAIAKEHPDLAIGLHWDVWGEDEREFDTTRIAEVRAEFERQLDAFERLTGRLPTHVDSHRHAHRQEHLMPVFEELVEPLGVPLRGNGSVAFIGGFYAQWEWQVTDLEYVSVPFLQHILRQEVKDGWTEISCHPGYATPGSRGVYVREREAELRTLADTRIRDTIEELGMRLASYAEYPAETSRSAG